MSTIGALTAEASGSYQTMFNSMAVPADKKYLIDAASAKIISGKPQYQAIEAATKVPWYFIGLIHYRESSCDFTRHLHNGDPLTARTIHVPAGRPVNGNPPFTFYQSAVDALQYQGLIGLSNWSISDMLYRLEAYNGFGYQSHNVNTPYLWNYTQFYTSGLFVADHIFSDTAISTQAGLAPVLKAVMGLSNTVAGDTGITVLIVTAIVVLSLIFLLYSKNTATKKS